MQDPRAGAYAVVGLVLLLLGKWVALREVTPLLLVFPPVMGRWAMVLAAYAYPYARDSGTGAYFREGLGRMEVLVATVAALLMAVIAGWPVLLIVVVAPLTVLIVGRWAAFRLGGGLTGDVYGALCELTELVCLMALSTV
jgi:adenosylcobinamide-GDP ribazoletransferase